MAYSLVCLCHAGVLGAAHIVVEPGEALRWINLYLKYINDIKAWS